MVELAALAAVLTTITNIIRIVNGFLPAYREAEKLLSDKGKTEGEKKFNKIITWLRWVDKNVQDEVTYRIDSKCNETSITADLKPLRGELAEAWSLVSGWRDKNDKKKNCWSRRRALKEFIEKWEKSEEAISRRLREFSAYTRLYEARQHIYGAAKHVTQQLHVQNVTQQARQHINGAAKHVTQQLHAENVTQQLHVGKLIINGDVKIINGDLNLNLRGCSATQPYNGHGLQMKKENNGHQSLMEKEKHTNRAAKHVTQQLHVESLIINGHLNLTNGNLNLGINH